MGRIQMEIGAVTDQVTVTAQGVAVQTASAERAGVITTSQLANRMTKGRNAMSLVSLMPGVVDGQGVGNTERIDCNFDIGVQDNRRHANTVTVDTQFSALDTAARFDTQGNQVNSRLSEFTASRAPRIMQLALRFTF